MKTKTLKPILIFFTFITMFLNIKVLAAPDSTTEPNLPLSEIQSQYDLFKRVAEEGTSVREKISIDGKEFLLLVVNACHQFALEGLGRNLGSLEHTFDDFLKNAASNEVKCKKYIREITLKNRSTGMQVEYDYYIVEDLKTNFLQIILQSYDPENC